MLRSTITALVAMLGLLLVAINDSSAAESTHPAPTFADIQPILENYCYGCHGYGSEEGGVSLDAFEAVSEKERLADHKTWLAVTRNVQAQVMPPADADQPSAEERELLQRWIERKVFRLDPANPDPGRVTIRRLNRDEYRYTIQDLFGHSYNTTEAFPPDDTGYGFDTIGDVLSMSPLLTEKYFDAAQEIVSAVVPTNRPDKKSKEYGKYQRIFLDGHPPEDKAAQTKYARKILKHHGTRVYRRPIDDGSLDRLMAIYQQISELPDHNFEHGIGQAFAAMLTSPRFLFRAEVQSEPNNSSQVASVDEFALASRLSYFLWCSTPDDELLKLATEGKLRDQLHQQVDRMLDHDKSQRFIRRFVGQWLQAQDVETISIDARKALGLKDLGEANRIFGRTVRQAMREETEMMFDYVLKQNRPATDLLTPDYTFLNEPLAKFYGLKDLKVEGNHMRKVDLPEGTFRGGILMQGSVLVVTSNPTRTSPVKRGLFLLDNILGAPAPPPPPPDVPALEAVLQRGKKLTMREQMELHRSEALCNSCHSRMDPLGLALESFNYLGAYQKELDGQKIETGGQLITGEEFSDVRELSEVLATGNRKIDFYRCLTEKILTFALGRGLEYYDIPTVNLIVDDMLANNGQMRRMVHTLVDSAPFQKRRGDGA